MDKKYQIILLALLLSLLSGCVNYSREAGVESLWREKQNFTNGKTNTQQVLKALGPPSQVLALNKKTIYYYLKEQVTRQGLILLIYNETHEVSIYDRAIFIFDEQGVLEDHSFSKQAEKAH